MSQNRVSKELESLQDLSPKSGNVKTSLRQAVVETDKATQRLASLEATMKNLQNEIVEANKQVLVWTGAREALTKVWLGQEATLEDLQKAWQENTNNLRED